MSALIFHGTAKKIPLVLLLWLAWSISPVKGQGVQVVFANITSSSNACGPRINAPIYGVQGGCYGDRITGNATNNGGTAVYVGPLLAGTGYTAALFAGTDEASARQSIVAIGQTTFRTGTAAGYIPTRFLDVPWFTPAPGSKLAFQVRAWDNRGGTVTSWAAVMADPSLPHGLSDVFSPSCPDPLPGQPQQIHMSGLTSFNLSLAAIAPYFVRSYTTNVIAMPGETVTLAADVFACQGTSPGTITQQWRRAGLAIPGATNLTLVLSNVSHADAGKYVLGTALNRNDFRWPLIHTMRLFIPPRITGIQFSPPLTATLTYDTGPDLNISVQAATSLSNWFTLHTGPATGQFQDNSAKDQTRRYRLRLEP